jgi:hypothetical protein
MPDHLAKQAGMAAVSILAELPKTEDEFSINGRINTDI